MNYNITKIRNELKWSESRNFDDGLQETIDWYLNNNEWSNEIPSDIFTSSTPWKN